MMRVFTYLDYANGVCSVAEIETPWISRWSKTDAAMGACDDSMVGTPKGDMEPSLPEPLRPLTRDERKQSLNLLVDKIIRVAHEDTKAFLDDNSANLNKLIELANRLDERETMPTIAVSWDAFGLVASSDVEKLVLTYVDAGLQAEALASIGL